MLNWLKALLLGESAILREVRAIRREAYGHFNVTMHRFDVLGQQLAGEGPDSGTAGVAALRRSLNRIEHMMTANQDKIDALAGQLGTATDGLRTDLSDLKAQIANGTPAEDLDFTALDARVEALASLDAETPAAPVEGSADGESPFPV